MLVYSIPCLCCTIHGRGNMLAEVEVFGGSLCSSHRLDSFTYLTNHTSFQENSNIMSALRGIRVLEFAGLAPGPYCGMILADFGASVIRIDRTTGGAHEIEDQLARGKKSLSVDMKSDAGRQAIKRLVSVSDVIIDPFRPGVMEKYGFGPKELCEEFPRLVYARLTGWGQEGPYANMAGHDINYIAISGSLSLCARENEKPLPPVNLLGDFAGGGMLCAMGISMALLERASSGRGQVVDAAMVDGSAYIASFVHRFRNIGFWNDVTGTNLLDTGAPFYDTYRCADDRFVAVGAIEPQFYKLFLEGLGFSKEEISELPHQMNMGEWPTLKKAFEDRIRTKTRDEWARVFEGSDACVTAVLSLEEAPSHPHNVARATMRPQAPTRDGEEEGGGGVLYEPSPAPRLSRTPGLPSRPLPAVGQHSEEVLREAGLSPEEVRQLVSDGIIMQATPPLPASKL